MLYDKVNYYFRKIYMFLELKFWNYISFIYFSQKNKKLKEIIHKNRKFLNAHKTFILKDEYKKNDFGIPKHIFENINKPINNRLTYSDLIPFLITSYKKSEVNYLEIGVSVLKNFMQINENLKNSNLVAYDINDIANSFTGDFELLHPNFYTSIGEENTLHFFKGDVLNKNDIKMFKHHLNKKYDFVMSDAMHTKEGIISEYENIISGSLNSNFIIYYDDLDFPELLNAAKKIANDLSKNHQNLSFFTFWISGWVGNHEKMHKNGIISNLPIKDILKKEKIKLPFMREINF